MIHAFNSYMILSAFCSRSAILRIIFEWDRGSSNSVESLTLFGRSFFQKFVISPLVDVNFLYSFLIRGSRFHENVRTKFVSPPKLPENSRKALVELRATKERLRCESFPIPRCRPTNPFFRRRSVAARVTDRGAMYPGLQVQENGETNFPKKMPR